MKIVSKSINELTPYNKNPRKNDEAVQYVINSIKSFGFKVPIVIDNKNIVVTGHTRLKAAKELGLLEVPCIIADDLTEEQIKAFRLADNKVAEFSQWDIQGLNLELEELDLNMNDFGFLDNLTIDWEDVAELSEETYSEPTKKPFKCPNCEYVGERSDFK